MTHLRHGTNLAQHFSQVEMTSNFCKYGAAGMGLVLMTKAQIVHKVIKGRCYSSKPIDKVTPALVLQEWHQDLLGWPAGPALLHLAGLNWA